MMGLKESEPRSPDFPVLDAGALRSSGPAREHALRCLREAAQKWGFFELRGHGIGFESMQRLFAAQRKFFDLPLPDKLRLERTEINARGYNPAELTKNRVDAKEILDFGHKPEPDAADAAECNRVADGWNQLPADPAIRDPMWAWYRRCEPLAIEVCTWLLEALGTRADCVPAPGAHTSFLRLNRYPDHAGLAQLPGREPHAQGALGIHHHTDAGLLTLLVQDGPAALQVLHRGNWHLIEPEAGSFIVNTGDMLQVLSNDAFPAPVHRVLGSVDGAPRMSAAYFFNPPYDQRIEPLVPDRAPASGFKPAYRPFTWQEFRGRRAAGDYADIGEEVQISHYRT